MLDDAGSNLRSALRDLGEGLRVLLGAASLRLAIVSELLEARDRDERSRGAATGPEPGRRASRPPHPARRHPGRRRSRAALVLVK